MDLGSSVLVDWDGDHQLWRVATITALCYARGLFRATAEMMLEPTAAGAADVALSVSASTLLRDGRARWVSPQRMRQRVLWEASALDRALGDGANGGQTVIALVAGIREAPPLRTANGTTAAKAQYRDLGALLETTVAWRDNDVLAEDHYVVRWYVGADLHSESVHVSRLWQRKSFSVDPSRLAMLQQRQRERAALDSLAVVSDALAQVR